MKSCLNCNTSNLPDEANFCPVCGQVLEKSNMDLSFNVKGVTFIMKYVEGGTFMMGEDCYVDYDERPQHEVKLDSYYIGETQVTQELWKAVMGDNPSKFIGNKLPVENVSWNDCKKFIEKLNIITGKSFNLPTEAQWEYAARGGINAVAGSCNDVMQESWNNENSDRETHPVGKKRANPLGLYDVLGNVWEWCCDYYNKKYYSDSPYINPTGPISGSNRVLRGGSWETSPNLCRVTRRIDYRPGYSNSFTGLRLALKSNL